ncbi:histone deacetylase 2-like, partial [Miscanthus floridulus]|uniref:histone deacetylase 2-like n=1 Tax=Miscanthus floridulus TaxID=154761 RepID=UPI0034597BF4
HVGPCGRDAGTKHRRTCAALTGHPSPRGPSGRAEKSSNHFCKACPAGYRSSNRHRIITNLLAEAWTAGDPSAAEALRRGRILSSRLYLDGVPSSKAPVVYSPAYDIEFNGIEKQHPFDSAKWGRVRNFLVDAGLLQDDRIIEPLEASEDDLLVVHSESYLSSLKSSAKVARIVEISLLQTKLLGHSFCSSVPAVALLPNLLVQQKLLYPFRKQVGGSILSAKLALERGWAINIGGGFHHCSAEEGGGFCAYADISLCIHFAFVRLNISRVMIIDLDAHQGNGHEKDFGSDGRVYTLDMYYSGIYPFDHVAKYIDQKVELDSGTKTEDYLEILDKALKVAESRFQPQLILYNAGTDILDGDPLGSLKVSPEGVITRDEKVFRFAKDQSIPLLMLTSGGYMKSSARVIADSIVNISNKNLIDIGTLYRN